MEPGETRWRCGAITLAEKKRALGKPSLLTAWMRKPWKVPCKRFLRSTVFNVSDALWSALLGTPEWGSQGHMWKSGHQNASVPQANICECKVFSRSETNQVRSLWRTWVLLLIVHWKVESTRGQGQHSSAEPLWRASESWPNFSKNQSGVEIDFISNLWGQNSIFNLAIDGLKRCGQYLRANFTKNYRRMGQVCEFVEKHGDSKRL